MPINKKSILITGSSTGIGKETALYLDKLGFKVFACVRNQQDGDNLKKEASELLTPLLLDVTNEVQIKEAYSKVLADKEYQFYGLVNNAGIGMRSVLELIPKEDFQRVFDINVIGLHVVTRIFLPLIRKNKGRIINIGSEASFIAGGGGGAYAASKFAVRALSDALRLEMIPYGVFVSHVAPTSTESAIWEKNQEDARLRKGISDELRVGYNYFFKLQDRATKERSNPIPTLMVTKDIVDALTSEHPEYEYYSGEKSRKTYEVSLLDKKRITRCSIKRLAKFIKLYG